jgi:DNA adenine methylase
MRSPIIWYGGKGNLSPKLLKYVPYHTYYVEVFGGGASMLFAKQPAKFEVYNDVDNGLVNMFRVIRDADKFKEFYRLVSLTPYASEECRFCNKVWRREKDDVKKAYYFYVAIRTSFSGILGAGWGYNFEAFVSDRPKHVSAWLAVIKLLPEIHSRIMTVQIDSIDWKKCLERYNWKTDGFAYLDPPYHPVTRSNTCYPCEFSGTEHIELVNYLLLKRWHGKVMLSGYQCETYELLEDAGWQRVDFEVGCDAVGRTRLSGLLGEGATIREDQRRTESIWLNYDPEKQKFGSHRDNSNIENWGLEV